VRFEVLMAVRMIMFWVLMPCRLVGKYQHTVSIFRDKVAMLGSGGIYI
jgi:hypothetical protein